MIHTVLERAFVAIAGSGNVLDSISSQDQKNHGMFLHSATENLLSRNNIKPEELDAIAVTIGPGSYTGIRVGLSAAKGLAFAIRKPVIPVSTLELLAATAIDKHKSEGNYLPLIHARQAEYFAGWYDETLMMLHKDAVAELQELTAINLEKTSYFYFGPNITPALIRKEQFQYLEIEDVDENSFSKLAHKKMVEGVMETAAQLNPSYLKAAYTTIKPKPI